MAEFRNQAGNRNQSGTVRTQRTERRYWRRSEEPREGWWPWGLLPLIGLLLTFGWGACATAPAIERDTAHRVSETLSAADFGALTVEADGQDVWVRGTADETEHARIRSIARGAACDTWIADDLVCPTNVHLELDAAVAGRRAHEFTFRREGNAVTLEGEVPDEGTRTAVVAEAQSRFADVADNLRVTGEPAREGYAWAALRSWPLLEDVSSGETSWKDGRFSARGRTTAAGEAAVRDAFAAPKYPKRLGDLRLEVGDSPSTPLSSADRCNDRFAEVLAASTIRFRTGSSQIAGDSQRLIQTLAELAQSCPMALDVEGHTDNVGSVELNKALSLARAQAVVAALGELGVEGSRLTPRGVGPSQPVADNATREGRALNRRIEIKATRIE